VGALYGGLVRTLCPPWPHPILFKLLLSLDTLDINENQTRGSDGTLMKDSFSASHKYILTYVLDNN
jgi:hypothetical protein